MSGGAWEYVMGVMVDANGNLLSGVNASNHSGFIGGYGQGGSASIGYSWPEEKYYDKYAYGTNASDYTRGHLGDATNEMGPFRSIVYASGAQQQISSWYDSYANFINQVYPWFIRGGSYKDGSESGMFAFAANYGTIHENIGFRVVLMP